MASLRDPKTWAPYINTKDCSLGFCSEHCPQWCSVIFPPPPPFEYPERDSGSTFSPLVIATIGVMASAFLLVSYYAIFAKYCKDRGSRREQQVEEMESIHQALTVHETWHFSANNGLDEALVKLITVCQYKRGDGLVEGTECSVCLSEFEEGERLRLLPKCSHAFHLPCIDVWLKSHSSCPLCRANVAYAPIAATQSQPPPSPVEADNSVENQSEPQMQEPQDENAALGEGSERNSVEENEASAGNDAALKDLLLLDSQSQTAPDNCVVELRDRHGQPIKRSVSTGYFQISVADSLLKNEDEDVRQEDGGLSAGEGSAAGYGSKVLRYVPRPAAIKRSFSNGIYFENKHAGGHNSTMIPF